MKLEIFIYNSGKKHTIIVFIELRLGYQYCFTYKVYAGITVGVRIRTLSTRIIEQPQINTDLHGYL